LSETSLIGWLINISASQTQLKKIKNGNKNESSRENTPATQRVTQSSSKPLKMQFMIDAHIKN
jgi:hypothetical protein